MKKILTVTFFTIASFLLMTGCTTSKSYTYSVDTGDKIEIKLTTTGGYDISKNLPFAISKDEKTLSQGTFLTIDGYNQYISIVNSDNNAQIIESSTKNGLEYTFYSYNDSEYNYVIKVIGSNTGLLIGNNVSEDSARKCFDRLTITKK